jgi:hypothetical protein
VCVTPQEFKILNPECALHYAWWPYLKGQLNLEAVCVASAEVMKLSIFLVSILGLISSAASATPKSPKAAFQFQVPRKFTFIFYNKLCHL